MLLKWDAKKSETPNSKVKLIEIHYTLFGFLVPAWSNCIFTIEMTLWILDLLCLWYFWFSNFSTTACLILKFYYWILTINAVFLLAIYTHVSINLDVYFGIWILRSLSFIRTCKISTLPSYLFICLNPLINNFPQHHKCTSRFRRPDWPMFFISAH